MVTQTQRSSSPCQFNPLSPFRNLQYSPKSRPSCRLGLPSGLLQSLHGFQKHQFLWQRHSLGSGGNARLWCLSLSQRHWWRSIMSVGLLVLGWGDEGWRLALGGLIDRNSLHDLGHSWRTGTESPSLAMRFSVRTQRSLRDRSKISHSTRCNSLDEVRLMRLVRNSGYVWLLWRLELDRCVGQGIASSIQGWAPVLRGWRSARFPTAISLREVSDVLRASALSILVARGVCFAAL